VESPLSGFGLEEFFGSFWHFGFLASPFAPMLIEGREKEVFSSFAFGDFVFRREAFPPENIAAYVAAQTRPGRLDAGFGYYRALQKSSEFFLTSVHAPWTMPVLALNGDHGMQGATAKSFAKIVPGLQTGMVKDSGHFIQEEQPWHWRRCCWISFRLQGNNQAERTGVPGAEADRQTRSDGEDYVRGHVFQCLEYRIERKTEGTCRGNGAGGTGVAGKRGVLGTVTLERIWRRQSSHC
jgi:hypothetical protein